MKAFSVASWNISLFAAGDTRNATRISFLAEQAPDVVAIYEVQGREVWRELMAAMPNYSFFVTEGRNTQQILLGTAPHLSAFVTQRIEFQAENAAMRPGALLTVKAGVHYFPLLFLHLASLSGARGFGLRADMLQRAFEFKLALERIGGAPANYIFLGDLNTAGMQHPFGRKPDGATLQLEISEQQEIGALAYQAGRVGMRVLSKSAEATYGSPGGQRGNLDHVVAAQHLRFTSFGGRDVDVRGWPKLPSTEQRRWIETLSDHALLYFEVHYPE